MKFFNDALPGMRVGDKLLRSDGDHLFSITATNEVGCDTGRRRYRVECVTCNVIVHEATTGPLQNTKFHLREAAFDQGGIDGLMRERERQNERDNLAAVWECR